MPTNEEKVAVVSPEGEYGYVPKEEYEAALAEGYSPPTREQTFKQSQTEYYSSAEQQVRTFVENAAKSATFGLSTGAQIAAGTPPEAIAARAETNPTAKVFGETAGVVAPMVVAPGASIIGRAGEAAALGVAKATGKKAAEGAAAKVASYTMGQRIAKEAVEGAVFSAGDEVSKAFLGDPNQTVESVMGNIGLGAAIGGGVGLAFGTGEAIVAPIWKATKGSELGRLLEKLKDRANGVSGASELEDLAKQAGMDISPTLKGAMTPEGAPVAQSLREAATPSGRSYQSELESLHQQASDSAVAGLGRSKKDIERIKELSDYEQGATAREALVQEVEAAYAPVAKQYDSIKARVDGKAVPVESIPILQERLSKVAIETGAALRPGSDEARMMKSMIDDAKNIKTLADLDVFQSSVNADLTAKQMFSLRGKVMSALRDQEEIMIGQVLGKEAPDLIDTYAMARAGYREMMDKIDLVADRLRPGKFSGPKGFIASVKEMAPEDVIRRLNGVKDVDLQRHLSTFFPGAAKSVKDYHLNNLLKKAANAPRALEGGIDTRTLFRQIDNLSPELREFLLDAKQQEMLNGVRGVVERLPERLNPSGTAKAMDGKLSSLGGGAAGVVLDLMTGSPGVFTVVGAMAKLLGRDVPDAIRLGLLKVIGSDTPVDAVAFKSLVTMAEQAYSAAKQTNRIMGNLLKPGTITLVENVAQSDLDKLDKKIVQAQQSPDSVMNQVSGMSSYLPEQAAHMGAALANSVAYLSKLRPSEGGAAPLDPPRVPNAIEKAKYRRALAIAERPAIVLQALRDGSLTTDDVMTLGTLYPALYKQYQNQVMEQIADARAKGTTIPYKRIVSLGLFMQMPLESSTMPPVMAANQALQMTMQQPAQPTQAEMKSLKERSDRSLTNNQANRKADRQSN